MSGQTAGHRWPVVGRERALATVDAILSDVEVGGAVLVGPPGVGKTALAARLSSDAAGRGETTVHLVATPAAGAVPYGALTGLGDLVPAGGGGTVRAAVWAEAERAVAALRAEGERPPLVVLDDAPLLDPSSADLLADLVRRRLVRLLATARGGLRLAPELDGLLVEGVLIRHQVQPLTAEAIRRAAEAALDGPLHPDTAATLFDASRGVPLHARELVQVNLAAGRLVAAPGGWVFDDVPTGPPSLIELVTSRFGLLAEDERRVFEVVALAQPLPLAAASSLAGVSVLAELEQAELVIVEDDPGGPMVRLGHPLYDDAIHASLGPLQLRRAAARAAEAIEALPQLHPDLQLRSAVLRLDHDLPVTPDVAVASARRALALVDPHLAERLVSQADGSFDAFLVLGTALSAQGRHDDADRALQDALAAARDDAERARAISRRGNNLGTGAGRFDEAIAVLEEGLDRVVDPRWRSFVSADLAYARLWTGAVDGPVGGRTDASKPDAVRANECLIGAVVAVMQGELALTEELVTEGLPLAPALQDDVPTARELLTLSRFLALAFAGDRSGAEAVVAAELEHAAGQSPWAAGTWIAVRSIQRLYGGDLSGALADARDAERSLTNVDISGLRPVVQAIRSTALAQLGDVRESLLAAESVEAGWRDETKVRIQLAVAEAWRTVMAGHPQRAAGALAAAGQVGLDHHHVAFGAFAAHDAVRLGHPRPALPVLREAARRLEGPLAATLLSHAELLAAGDAEGLLALAPALPDLGFTLAGAEAASQAARLFEQAGSLGETRRADFVAATLAQPLAGVRSPTLGRPRGLTPREREIATLAARRERSRDIAASLGISARTVDNHLAAVYQKLGVANRTELSGRLGELEAT